MSTTTHPEATREQEDFAEACSLRWESVGVTVLDDGNVLVYCRGDLHSEEDPNARFFARVEVVDRDGQPLDISARIDRSKHRAAEALTEVEALDRSADDLTERLRALALRASDAVPQSHERLVLGRARVATRRLETKGGVSQEVGDLVLLTPEPEESQPGFRPFTARRFETVYSFRRNGFVSTPVEYLRER